MHIVRSLLLDYVKMFGKKLTQAYVPSHFYYVWAIFFHTSQSRYTKVKLVRCSYKHRLFENTKLLAGNDHVIDIFTSEDMENISHCVFLVPHCLLYNKSACLLKSI